MLLLARYIRHKIAKVDQARDAKIEPVEGVKDYRDVIYNPAYKKYGLLDVFRPEASEDKLLPTIINVHGGGWMYGTKETYYLYCRYLAFLGFAVISYSYPLAPEHKFPLQLKCLDEALLFTKEHAKDYAFDLNKIFLIGDSAGAQMAFQYGVMLANKDYASLFPFSFPLSIKGYGLNCGTYRGLNSPNAAAMQVAKWYLPKHYDPQDPRYNPLEYLPNHFPPIYLMTADNDFLKDDSIYFDKVLNEKKIPHAFKIYESDEKEKLEHVFQCNLAFEKAKIANREETNYLLEHLYSR